MTEDDMTTDSADAKNNRLAEGWHGGAPSAEEQRVLDERAEAFRQADSSTREGDACASYIAIRLTADDRFGIAYTYLEEIMPDAPVTPVPCVPGHVAGVANRQGDLLTVLDLAAVLGITGEPIARKGNAPVVVVQYEGRVVGLRVGDIIGYDEFDPKALKPPIQTADDRTQRLFGGIWGRDTTLLNIPALLSDSRIVVDDHHQLR